jgi:CheY-like chemotaxis protein
MVTEPGKSTIVVNLTPDELFERAMRKIDTYLYASIFGLLVSVILLSLNLRLVAGILVIISISSLILFIRKYSSVITGVKESVKNVTFLNDRKDGVITDFSHKIREPLNNIVIITDLLMKSGLQQKQKDLLETFIASTNNMVSTVNALTMQSAGNTVYEKREHFKFNLYSTIENTIELYKLKEKSNLDFILNKKDLLEFECYGDPIIIKQIFLALFNTIENKNPDLSTKVTINLRKEKTARNGSNILFRIQTDQNITLINSSDANESLTAKLIRAGNGTYDQELEKNFTVLNISMPFPDRVPEKKPQIASPRIEEFITRQRAHKELKDIKLLLVEDNIINQKITLLSLKSLVHCIDTASNGKEALDKFGSSSYDLILMDIQMPVMSGLIAAEKIRALEASTNSHVPIIAITANAMLGDKEKCMSSGFDDYISKPFQPSALIEKIKKNL